MAPHAHTPGIARACAECHKRKIRCDVRDDGQSCSNCKLYGTVCQLRARKRRRTNHDPTADGNDEANEPASGLLPRRQNKRKSEAAPQALHEDLTSPSASPRETATQDADDRVGKSNTGSHNDATDLDYSDYYGHHMYLKAKLDGQPKFGPATLSDSDRDILRITNAFDLPQHPLKIALIESFMKYCRPWVPIFDQRWLWDGRENGSLAFTQAVMVAGARTTDIALACQEHYSAAKYLLLCGHETNPLLIIVSCLLLGWWNQTSPDIVSLDNSTSWIRQAVGVAYQIDLHKEPRASRGASYRRRLWWTLVARDSQLSASHGRPRYINLAICNIQPLSLTDMPDDSIESQVFVAYVRASIILGDLAESCQQGKMTTSRFTELRNALLWWLKELPATIKSIDPASEENFNMRQVYMVYISSIAILHRSVRASGVPSAVELMASSFIVGLFKEFLDGNELRRLSAGFNFYPLVAAIPLLEARQFRTLREIINVEMNIITETLTNLGQRWPSGHRGLRVLERIQQTASPKESKVLSYPQMPSDSDLLLFENFEYSMCSIRDALMGLQNGEKAQQIGAEPQSPTNQEMLVPYLAIPTDGVHEQPTSTLDQNFDLSLPIALDDPAFWFQDMAFNQDLFGGWMLNDDAFGGNLSL